ncbi:dihydrolipoamide acetyltransferase [Aliiroseovarius zhejiangensis]|uniref:Dihydrolipoamide acetyltransferase n=1 Tax=Aliiroseovarius zhejiangensis TaxID=1632025 RepID=A0ABQ3J123_9RHOB|nr:alpha/beta hydrolase [Aliiroseovarius zhejiangensis]GHE97820.1 dihydrolipoamide acetyltransferase [Aliiroseovarius zhejiangensis]
MTLQTLAGHQTYWHRSGNGSRSALMIHCSLAHSGAWRGVERQLADLLTMVALDLPGHGRSADWDGVGDFQDTAVIITEALWDQECPGPIDLIGHSFGGTIALRLAQRRPDLVRSLTLFEPVVFAAARGSKAFADNLDVMNGPFAAALDAGDRMKAAHIFNTMWGRDSAWQALPISQREDMAKRIHLIPAANAVIYADVHGQVAPGALERVNMPVLLMEGTRSPALVGAVHDVLEARLPDVQRHVIDGAGHMAPITHAGEVAGLMSAFLRETESLVG